MRALWAHIPARAISVYLPKNVFHVHNHHAHGKEGLQNDGPAEALGAGNELSRVCRFGFGAHTGV